jgi:hypothetical protein
MTEQQHTDGVPPENAPPEKTAGNDVSLPGGPSTARALTPEEQMALFEKDLKENDWGHQPC